MACSGDGIRYRSQRDQHKDDSYQPVLNYINQILTSRKVPNDEINLILSETRNHLSKRDQKAAEKLAENERNGEGNYKQLREKYDNLWQELLWYRKNCSQLYYENRALLDNLSELQRVNETLLDENLEFRKKHEMTTLANKELSERISRMLANQEKDRNDPHENLMDLNRPSRILSDFRNLYSQEYGSIVADLQENCQRKTEKNIYESLLFVLKKCFDETKKMVETAKENAKEKVTEIFNKNPFNAGFPKNWMHDVCMMLRASENIIDTGIKSLQEDLMKKFGKDLDQTACQHLDEYIDRCVKLTWLMNASHPPMYLHFEEGKVDFDPEKHKQFNSKGKKVDYFLWPCVYFSKESWEKNSKVMAKAEVWCCH